MSWAKTAEIREMVLAIQVNGRIQGDPVHVIRVEGSYWVPDTFGATIICLFPVRL